MNSCIYEGRVLHRRFQPSPHAFTYRLFMMYLDLSELDQVFRKRWFWSAGRPNIAWFRRKEHLGDPMQTLDESIRDYLLQQTGEHHRGPIRMLTHLRYFGMQMNPVTFYFCFHADGDLKHIVAEVNNTPWGQQHCYLLGPHHFSGDHSTAREPIQKDFHVSPFMPMDMVYQWRVSGPDERLNIGIATFQEERRMLNVAMTAKRVPMTAAAMRRVLLRYPLMTSQVFAGIYWQAFRLWRKKIPFFTHPDKRPPTTADPKSTTDTTNLATTPETCESADSGNTTKTCSNPASYHV